MTYAWEQNYRPGERQDFPFAYISARATTLLKQHTERVDAAAPRPLNACFPA